MTSVASYTCLGKNNDDDASSFNEFSLKNSDEETILGIKINPKLTFNSHIKTLCTKAGQILLRNFKDTKLS